MRPASERLDQHTVRVWVAADSFGPLAERVRGMLLGDPASCGARGRLMSVITLFPHGNRAAVPEIHTSMSLDPSVENPIVVRESDYDHRLNVALAPGPHSFGFGYPHRPSHRTEQDAARRAPSSIGTPNRQIRDLTAVSLQGFAGQPHREDRIEIDHWNTHGVHTRTIVAFEADPWEHERIAAHAAWVAQP